ncbi:MAG: hypothetical protein LW850_09215 [Planctomycetaceae bacterium]|nr:hypothetical protein [Planctomycetaceae bacterium]
MSGASVVVLEDYPRSGLDNMQIDQQLLHAANPWELVQPSNLDVGKPSILIRLYYWSEPTLSLGNFQSIHELQHADDTLGHPDLGRLAWVQRKTGGGAVGCCGIGQDGARCEVVRSLHLFGRWWGHQAQRAIPLFSSSHTCRCGCREPQSSRKCSEKGQSRALAARKFSGFQIAALSVTVGSSGSGPDFSSLSRFSS